MATPTSAITCVADHHPESEALSALLAEVKGLREDLALNRSGIPRLLTVPEAARALRVSLSSFENILAQKGLPVCRPRPGCRRITAEAIEAFVRSSIS